MAASSSASQRVRPRWDAQQRRIKFPRVCGETATGGGGAGGVLNEGVCAEMEPGQDGHLKRKKKKLRERLRYQGRGQARAKTSPGNGAGKQAAWILEHATINNSFP